MQALSSCKSSGIRGGALTAGPRRSAVASASRALTTRINATVTIPKKYSTVTPVGDRVYVKLGAEEQTTASGILLPSSAVARSNEGQVVAAGKDAKLSVGAQVMFGKYSGTEVEVAEESYMLLKEADIIGTMPSSNVADLQPTGTRILVKAIKPEEQTRGGVMLGKNTEQQTIGKVVAVGPGTDDEPMTLKVGEDVMYASYSGMELEGDNEEEFVLLYSADVLAVLS
mmetsp:Transcript_24086/g.66947  ORF Transcript_24086/g.66947 Transcript_24086/m.66947 type:complete len:227 (+) Transcript_24086:98-778(+)|eukprot:CAMPEP_0117654298 /NCGR_PEP_ID=MMETSP0804-20121206/3669_1 /TAXON_ID=1074897 /ORGANISM="Tetraselmis astigmatica, Strain CCMP880" /LENGTH=226 /DNA_ID=CAMNT_0005460569 /DNA_START=594 /DNA_END=1274 /DNA_ORIENTATION=-